MKFKEKVKNEFKIFREEISRLEYAFWWIARIAMLYALLKARRGDFAHDLVLQFWAKFLASFILPAARLLPKKIFLARLPYRLQTAALFMLSVTSVLGQFGGLYSSTEWFDLVMHVIGGFLGVMVGYMLTKTLDKDGESMTPVISAVSGFGLSLFFATAWEIFEFFTDTLIEGSNAQNWMVLSSERMIAFFPEVDPRRHVLFDTMTDLIAGVVGTTIGGTVLFFYLYFKNRKSKNNK